MKSLLLLPARRLVVFSALVCLGLLLSVPTANAAVITYDVDLTATSTTNSHDLRVFGTITLDADLDGATRIESSELMLQHEGDTPRLAGSLPIQSSNARARLNWVDIDGDLFIQRRSVGSSFIEWRSGNPTFNGRVSFRLATGTNHRLQFDGPSEFENAFLTDFDRQELFLVGTSVPEPSTLAGAVMLTVGLVGSGRRKRS